jgi:DNA polymerase
MTGFGSLLDDVDGYLKKKIDEGETEAEISRETLNELSTPPSVINDGQEPESVPSQGGLAEITARIARCKKCSLHETRTKTVPGQGALNPDVMFIGEAPGADEDQQGLSFVGKAGKLLTKMITAMGYTRDEVFIGNILKCRPPENRKPTPVEIDLCRPYLVEQIKVINPKVIVALGATSVAGLLGECRSITSLRGNWMEFEGIPMMPTFHPAYLIYNQSAKHAVWDDLQDVLKHLGREIPEVSKKQE